MCSSTSSEAAPLRWLRRLVAAVALLPQAALACPQCYGSEPAQVLKTYYLSTLLLSSLPVVIIGTLVAVGFSIKRQMESAAAHRAVDPTH